MKPKLASLNELQADGWKHFGGFKRVETWPMSDVFVVEKDGRYMRSERFRVRDDDSDWPGSDAKQNWWPVKMVPKTINEMVDLKDWDEVVG